MPKVKVSICTGTACFVMGSSEILLLEDILPEEYKDKVEVDGMLCMDYCKGTDKRKPPFVKINNTLISEATVPKVMAFLEKVID